MAAPSSGEVYSVQSTGVSRIAEPTITAAETSATAGLPQLAAALPSSHALLRGRLPPSHRRTPGLPFELPYACSYSEKL